MVPGSPLILERGEPTRIVVHNRLPFPLGVHWHGLELESYYDGVAHWSGQPGSTRGMIPPADTMSVYITPPRAGTFMYHTHGELGARLAQGLYGTLIVLDRGHELNTDTDRLFVLASRGATLDADAAINGRGIQPSQHFSVGKTYRLRFTQISLDDVKNVRLLLNDKPVMWRPFARDGATLPAANRVETEAKQRMDVGETYDFEWTPAAPGVYVLEVATDYYPARARHRLCSELRSEWDPSSKPTCAWRQPARRSRLTTRRDAALAKLVGAYVSSTTAPSPDVVSVWSDSGGSRHESNGCRRRVAGALPDSVSRWFVRAGYLQERSREGRRPGRALSVRQIRRRDRDGRECAFVPARCGVEAVGHRTGAVCRAL